MTKQSVHWNKQPEVKLNRAMTAAGCLPLAVGVALVLLLFFNLVTYVDAPSWISDVREWRIKGRLLVSFGVLASLQLIATWVLGLQGAVSGAQAYEDGGQERRARRLLIGPTLGVVALRLLLMGVGVLAFVLVLAGVFNPTIDGWVSSSLLRSASRYAGFIVGSIITIGLHGLAGPFLRARYSFTLGLWAATWPERDPERPWAAVSARLGAGFAGIFGLMWAVALVALVWLSLTDPILDRPGINWLRLMRDAPTPLANGLIGLTSVALIAGVVMLGQLFLPWLYRTLAQRRMQRADYRV